jgi:hypothetical protein
MNTAACRAGRSGEGMWRAVVGLGLEQPMEQAAAASIGAGRWSNGAAKWRTWPATVEASRPSSWGAAWALHFGEAVTRQVPPCSTNEKATLGERQTGGPHTRAKV